MSGTERRGALGGVLRDCFSLCLRPGAPLAPRMQSSAASAPRLRAGGKCRAVTTSSSRPPAGAARSPEHRVAFLAGVPTPDRAPAKAPQGRRGKRRAPARERGELRPGPRRWRGTPCQALWGARPDPAFPDELVSLLPGWPSRGAGPRGPHRGSPYLTHLCGVSGTWTRLPRALVSSDLTGFLPRKLLPVHTRRCYEQLSVQQVREPEQL